MKKKLISVTAPAFNEEACLPFFCQQVSDVLKNLPYDFEIVICENGSSDQSLSILKELKNKLPYLRFVSLSRNFGHQGGLLAGITHCRGDVVITMDADLQHPPEFIPLMVQKWEEGYKVVNTSKTNSNKSFIRNSIDKAFYSFVNHMAGFEMGQGDFRLMDRVVVNKLLELPECEKYIRGLVTWIGYSTVTIPYKVKNREFGESKFSLYNLFDFAFQGITSFSISPLRLIIKLGIVLFIPTFLILLFYVIFAFKSIVFHQSELYSPRMIITIVSITFFGSIQLITVGIIGEYIGRNFQEVKNRPKFIVSEISEGTIE